ncbi:MAG: RDD family protein [Bryobacteraceae bacterium]|nr:RDD family protein [Bryobacteraceae bacterium]
MSWFYSAGGEQRGPVEQAEFESLISTGVIRPETLVWQAGMPNWQSAADTRPDLLPPALPGLPAQTYTMPAPFTPGRRYGGFWIRFLARIIDGLVLAIPSLLVILLVVGASFFKQILAGDFLGLATAGPAMIVASLINAAMYAAYEAFTTSTYGGTLGKLALSLRVILPDGGMLSLQQAFIRHLIYGAGSILGLVPFVGPLAGLWTLVDNVAAAFDPQKRALHDRIANTFVIHK